MEVSEIQKTGSVGQLQRKEGIQKTEIKDHLSISSEAEKKAAWVEMLKEMPSVRPEKIESALHTSPTSYELAQKLIKGDT